jgi:RNA polymerase sigma-70 factor (ECF subfamily)
LDLHTDAPQCELPLHDLLAVCLDSRDVQLWEVLVRRLQPIFARVVYRVAGSTGAAQAGDVDDVVQECFLKLEGARAKPDGGKSRFDCPEAALAYLKVLAANTARDYVRKRNAEKRGTAKTAALDDRLGEIAGPDGPNLDRHVLMRQIDGLLGNPKERTIFWLYYRQGFTAKEIAGLPGIQLSAKGVESLLRRLALEIRKQLEGNSGPEAF